MENNLPEDWTEVQLEDCLIALESGSRPKGGVRGIMGGIPSIGGEHLNDVGGFDFSNIKYVPTQFAARMTRGRIQSGDILIVKDGATTGKTSFVNENFPHRDSVVNEHVFICRANPDINAKYLFYFLWSKEGKDKILENFKGSAQGGINTTFVSNLLIPLAPRPEQDRIVAKLDAIMQKVEANKQRLEKIPKLLKRFRQAVLAAAVSGKLTEEWREENPQIRLIITKTNRKVGKTVLDDKAKDYDLFDLPKTWRWMTVADVCDVKGGKRIPKGESLVSYNTGFPYIKAGDLKFGTVQIHKLEYLMPETREKIKRYIVSKGDVYITNVGACIGDAGIVPDELDGANLTENALKICNHEGVHNYYLSYWLQSPIAQNFIQQTILSAAQGKLALGRVELFPLPLPAIEEQKEIVHQIEKLFAFVDKVEARYLKAKAMLDRLPQSILAKAFRGELLPNDSNDEQVSEIMNRITVKRNMMTSEKKVSKRKLKDGPV